MKLKPRTTYIDGRGNRVCIAGPAHRVVDMKPCWWSIQGDHYTEDGRFVHSRRIGNDREKLELESYTIDNDTRSLVSEDESKTAVEWWNGVVT